MWNSMARVGLSFFFFHTKDKYKAGIKRVREPWEFKSNLTGTKIGKELLD